MNNNQLYLNSSNELMLSRNIQLQISQKEFELQLLNINDRYSSYKPYPYQNIIKKQSLELEISNLKNNRDIHLGFAIESALLLAEQDLISNNVYSMASIAISSINSFLQSQKIDFKLSYSAQVRLSKISFLMQSKNNIASLNTEIARLKNICNLPIT